MKFILALFATFAFASFSHARRPPKVKASEFTCEELKSIVQEEGTVHVYGFGSLLVHSTSKPCRKYKFGERQEAYKTTWKTLDRRFCTAGFSCRVRFD